VLTLSQGKPYAPGFLALFPALRGAFNFDVALQIYFMNFSHLSQFNDVIR
jgi:hypothetical protein